MRSGVELFKSVYRYAKNVVGGIVSEHWSK